VDDGDFSASFAVSDFFPAPTVGWPDSFLSAACCWLSLESSGEVAWLEDDLSEVSCFCADPALDSEALRSPLVGWPDSFLSAVCCWLSWEPFREFVWLDDDWPEVSCSRVDPGVEAELWLSLGGWLGLGCWGLVVWEVPVVTHAANHKLARTTVIRLRVFITVCKIRFCYLGVKQ
jgi:hypothetical protein